MNPLSRAVAGTSPRSTAFNVAQSGGRSMSSPVPPPQFSGVPEDTPPTVSGVKIPKRRLGLIKAGNIVQKHLRHAENRDEIKAITQYFAPRFAKYGVALVPGGFLLAGPVDWWAEKHVDEGRRKIETLISHGKLDPEAGPLGCAMQIERNWQSALDKKLRLSDEDAAKALNNIRGSWNKMMDHLFPDDADGISLVREKFKLSQDGRMFNLIGRSFHANRNGTVRFFKNFARKASNPVLGIVLKPVKWLMLGLGLLYQGILMLENGPAVQKLLRQTVRRVV